MSTAETAPPVKAAVEKVVIATKFHKLFASLAAPFEPTEVRLNPRGLRYVSASTVMNRLDDVLGPENWWDEYTVSTNSVQCRLTIRLPDGQEITKTDAGGFMSMTDPSDVDKTGYSDALKRVAVKFGVARYLYRCGVPLHAQYKFDPEDPDAFPSEKPNIPDDVDLENQERAAVGYPPKRAPRSPEHESQEPPYRQEDVSQDRDSGPPRDRQGTPRGNYQGSNGDNRGNAPRGSQGGYQSRSGSNGSSGGNRGGGGQNYGPPKNGKQLAGWAFKQEQTHGDNFKNFMKDLLKREKLPWRMADLSDDAAVWVYEQMDAEFNGR